MELEVDYQFNGGSMYNFSGIYYEMKTQCIIFGLVGLISLIISFSDKQKKAKFKSIILGVFCLFYSICSF